MGTVLNHDLVSIHNRFVRFIIEAKKSTSSNSSGVNQFDVDRMRQQLADIRSRVAHVQSAPLIDLPETHPKPFVLRELMVLPDVENEDINDLCRLCELGCKELELSSSAGDPCRLNKFDHDRCVAILDKIEALIEDHIVKVTPVDLPESSPRAEGVTAGRKVRNS
jgi:hypothetical protein